MTAGSGSQARGALEQSRARTIAIHQPYFLPYIGYYQLIAAVDLFIVYDDIKYTKSGWINRNRMLLNGGDAYFTLPLKAGSDYSDIRDRQIADNFEPRKLLNQFEGAYRRAPFFTATMGLLREVLASPDRNLFSFLHHSLLVTCRFLGISTPIQVSSTVSIDAGLKHQDRVLAYCGALQAARYINSIGGTSLYSKEEFAAHRVELCFLRARPFEYPQLAQGFVPWLSIVDVLMFNPLDEVRARIVSGYEILA